MMTALELDHEMKSMALYTTLVLATTDVYFFTFNNDSAKNIVSHKINQLMFLV